MLKLMLVFLTSTAFANDFVYVENPSGSGSTDQECLRYDDGMVQCFTWGGTYRGVWFNTEDFLPGSSGFLLEYSELWFVFVGTTYDCYAEVWVGGSSGPVTLLDRTLLVPFERIATYEPPLDCGTDFWIILNTTLSSGGWPAAWSDGSPPAVDHSFYSDDFVTWEPWSNGSTWGDYCFMGGGEFILELGHMTWGEIKSVF